jgi:ABC-type amino acid transport substrate-binding protein
VRVCIWPEYYGITYRNPKTGTVSGLDADLALELARELGVRLKFVDSSFAKVIPDLAMNQCDIAMMAVAVTPQRAEKVAFSQPYLRSDVYAVTTHQNRRVRNWADIDQVGTRVAVAAGTFHEPLMRERLKKAELVVVKAPQTREEELEAGRVDVFMSDFPFTRKMVDYHDWARVLPPPATYAVLPYAWAVQPGDADWLKTIDRFLATIKTDGRLARTAKRYGLAPIVITE